MTTVTNLSDLVEISKASFQIKTLDDADAYNDNNYEGTAWLYGDNDYQEYDAM